MHYWIKLTTGSGEDVPAPTRPAMEAALQELFDSSKDDEHPDCWLECGSENGPLYTLSIFQTGHGRFNKYTDVDMFEEQIFRMVEAPNVESSLRLWQALIDGRFDEI